jgi:hypothetical protein
LHVATVLHLHGENRQQQKQEQAKAKANIWSLRPSGFTAAFGRAENRFAAHFVGLKEGAEKGTRFKQV